MRHIKILRRLSVSEYLINTLCFDLKRHALKWDKKKKKNGKSMG